MRKNLLPAFLALWLLGACAGPQIHSGTARDAIVYFATNRMPTGDPNPDRAFAPVGRDNPQAVSYGKARVSIPADHAEGSYSGVQIRSYQPISMPHRAFFAAVNPGGLPAPPRDLIVYVHGYNNSFADAAKRAAIFAADLKPNSEPSAAIYSWPSAQALLSYWKDEDTVQLNQPNLRRFLFDINVLAHPSHTILVGHSMGCRALTFALRDYFLEELITHRGHLQPKFDELIFIEPDVNADYFKENLIGARVLCRRITIYTDGQDLALKASRFVHQYQSLGLSAVPPGKNVDVIDASAVRNDLLGHSYDGPVFFKDVRQLIQGASAAQRDDLVPQGDIYRLQKAS